MKLLTSRLLFGVLAAATVVLLLVPTPALGDDSTASSPLADLVRLACIALGTLLGYLFKDRKIVIPPELAKAIEDGVSRAVTAALAVMTAKTAASPATVVVTQPAPVFTQTTPPESPAPKTTPEAPSQPTVAIQVGAAPAQGQ